MELNPLHIENMVRTALIEDLGHGTDITSACVIDVNAQSKAELRSREDGVLAGLPLAIKAFEMSDPDLKIISHAKDGDKLEAGQLIASIEGNATSILMAERVALNFLIHMSGIASLTAQYVELVKGTTSKIADTRKTLAGLRLIQKYAVKMGGGHNHRFGLDDAILIKDNHIAIAGGINQVLNAAKENSGHTVKIEIEVDTLAQLDEVLSHGGADIVMLDNFSLQDLTTAIKTIDGALISEASGNVNLSTVRSIAETGVDYISVGALTHSAPAFDIGLDIDL